MILTGYKMCEFKNKLSEKQSKIIKNLCHQKKICVCKYKMVDISADTWNKAGVSIIKVHDNADVNKTLLLLLCISDIGKGQGGRNIYDQTDTEIKGKYNVKKMNELTKQIGKCKTDRSRLIRASKESMYVSEVIAIPIIMQSTLSNSKTIKFRSIQDSIKLI